jgi:exodeoxyribonuclease V alpha subunit
MPVEAETLKGRLEGVRHQGDNYWSVATLRTDRGQRVTIVGHLLTVEPGDSLRLSGEWKNDPRFGWRFVFSSFEVLAPSTDEGVVGFLESKLGDVGRNRAIEMVRRFGRDQIFDVIENEPQRLTEIAGITPERARQIHVDFRKAKGLREAMVFLKQFRLTDNQAARLLHRYGGRAPEVLQQDPYQLIDDIDGFGFKLVDEIARRVGVDHHGMARTKAGCAYLLQVAQDKGNTFMPLADFRRQVAKELAIAPATVDRALALLCESGSVVLENGRVYAARLHAAEQAVADKLTTLATPGNELGRTERPVDPRTEDNHAHAQ